jgi:hypothetical protein
VHVEGYTCRSLFLNPTSDVGFGAPKRNCSARVGYHVLLVATRSSVVRVAMSMLLPRTWVTIVGTKTQCFAEGVLRLSSFAMVTQRSSLTSTFRIQVKADDRTGDGATSHASGWEQQAFTGDTYGESGSTMLDYDFDLDIFEGIFNKDFFNDEVDWATECPGLSPEQDTFDILCLPKR